MVRLLAALTLMLSSGFAMACDFNGDAFLRTSWNKGIRPPAKNCYEVDLSANRFYARPDQRCEIRFESRQWLAQGWWFSKMTGVGKFSLQRDGEDFILYIEPAGGFRLVTVSIASAKDNCGSLEPKDVIR